VKFAEKKVRLAFLVWVKMVVRGNGARRRRLVVDPAVQLGESQGDEASNPSQPSKRQKTKNSDVRTYAYGADRRNQLKTTDLIPKRLVAYLCVVLVLLICLSLLNFAAHYAVRWDETIGTAGLELLAIQGPGSLASWFSSFLLIITGLASLQIYAMRQHRCDDYRGTYRVWLWMAALFMVASISCVADLGTVASNLFSSYTGYSFEGRAWLPPTAKLLALTVLAAGGLYEVRESRGSLAFVTFVWVAYAAAAVLPLFGATATIVGFSADVVAGNCVLFGTAALLLAHLTYGRFIFLDANGLIAQWVKDKKLAQQKKQKKKAAAAKRKKTKPAPSNKTTATPKRPARKKAKPASKSTSRSTGSDRPTVGTSSKSSKVEKTPSEVLRELAAASRAKEQTKHRPTVEDHESESVQGMSKAQRRKLRKLDKQRRRAA
jgi:hypothetical protein